MYIWWNRPARLAPADEPAEQLVGGEFNYSNFISTTKDEN